MASMNLGLRFVLELCAVAAVAYWGWHATDAMPQRLVIAVVAPLVLVGVWAVVIAPGAANPIPQTARMLLGTGLLALAAGALALAGQVAAGLAMATVVVINGALMFVAVK